MRWYRIELTGASGAFAPNQDGATWSATKNGEYNPEAQQVEFQIEEMKKNPVAGGNSTLTVHGVSFDQIKHSADIIGLPIRFYGGMFKGPGLPIAMHQSRNAGLLMDGRILQCWANWIGTDMSLGMSFVPAGFYDQAKAALAESQGGGGSGGSGGGGQGAAPSGQSLNLNLREGPNTNRYFNGTGFRSLDRMSFPRASPTGLPGVSVGIGGIGIGGMPIISFGDASATFGGVVSSLFGGGGGGLSLIKPINLIHNLLPNMPLASAIKETISKAFPSAGIKVLIKQGLQLAYQDSGMYQNLDQYAQYIQKLSNSILGTNNYPGVQFSSKSNTIKALDYSTPVSEGVVSVLDLIGQPTWININTISVKTVMRADLEIGSLMTIPNTFINQSPDAIIPGTPNQKATISFTGGFVIVKVMHIGDFRNPDGSSWSSNYEAMVDTFTNPQAGLPFLTTPAPAMTSASQ